MQEVTLGVVRQRHSSISSQGPVSPVENKKALGKATSEPKVAGGRPSQPKQSSPVSVESNPVILYINMLLARFAREQLATYRLKDLGCFAAHMEFHLVLWLGKERNRSAKIADFVAAVRTLHEDFAWPYPVLTSTLFEQIRKLSLENGSIISEEPSQLSAKDPLKIITANGGSVDSGFPKINSNGIELFPAHQEAPNVKRLLMHQHKRHNSLPAAKPEQAVLQPIKGKKS